VTAYGRFPPERFIGALTDFGPERGSTWGNSDPEFLTVHDTGPRWAEVTEGTGQAGGIWQRYRCDWSTPGVVRLDVLDSNAFGPGSSWEYKVTAVSTGTRIDLGITRVPTTPRGRVLDLLLALGGTFYFGRDLRRTVARLEAATEARPPSSRD